MECAQVSGARGANTTPPRCLDGDATRAHAELDDRATLLTCAGAAEELAANAEAFTADGWFRSGDLGVFADAHKNVRIVGRRQRSRRVRPRDRRGLGVR